MQSIITDPLLTRSASVQTIEPWRRGVYADSTQDETTVLDQVRHIVVINTHMYHGIFRRYSAVDNCRKIKQFELQTNIRLGLFFNHEWFENLTLTSGLQAKLTTIAADSRHLGKK